MKKVLKKVISVLAISTMAVSLLAGCGGGKTEEGKTEPAQEDGGAVSTAEGENASGDEAGGSGEREKLTIGFSFRSLDEAMTVWWDTTEGMIKEYNEDDSNPYTIEYFFTNADLDVDTQISDVDSLIVRQPDVICIQSVDTEGSVPAFEACKTADIPVIDFGFGTTFEDYTSSLITIDHYGSGVLQAQWLENYLEENPDVSLNIVYANGAQGIQQMTERYEGFCTLFDGDYKDRATLLDAQYCNFSADTAMATMEDWLQTFPELNCVVSANDEMCIGALQACISAKHEVISLGMDGNNLGMKAIVDDGYSGTVGFDFHKIAQTGLELSIAVASGGEFEKDTDISKEVTTVIDASNVDQYYEGE